LQLVCEFVGMGQFNNLGFVAQYSLALQILICAMLGLS